MVLIERQVVLIEGQALSVHVHGVEELQRYDLHVVQKICAEHFVQRMRYLNQCRRAIPGAIQKKIILLSVLLHFLPSELALKNSYTNNVLKKKSIIVLISQL